MTARLDAADIDRVVAAALAEDLGEAGDVTSDAVVAPGCTALARLVARQSLVVAGLPIAREVFLRLDPAADFRSRFRDGDEAAAGDEVASVRAGARALLSAERTALNVLQRLCGIATAARAAVREIEGTGAVVLDTRKTAPGLRKLDKYAVAVGGATNHRMGLFDAILIKDTHLAVAGSVGEAVRRALERGHPRERVTVEVRTPDELDDAVAAGAGRALLDNMDLDEMRECVRRGKGRIALEASGGLRPGGLRVVAETGVDYLSLGCLTHSPPAADLAMDLELLP